MKEQNNIDEIFKQAFDQFEVDPGKDMWTNVQSGVQSAATSGSAVTAASSSTFSWVASVIVAVSITGAAVGGYFYFNQKGEAKKNTAIVKNEQIPSNSTNTELTSKTKDRKEDIEVVELANAENQTQESNDAETANSNPKKEDQKNIVVPQQTEQINTENLNNSNSSEEELVSEPINDEELKLQDVTTNEITPKSNVNSSQSTEAINTETPTPKDNSQNKGIPTTDQAEKTSTNSSDSPNLENATHDVAIFIEFPNVFTPNQDGHTDRFEVVKELCNGLDQIEDARMIIQNTTGKVIYQWNGIEGSWNGNLPNGTAAPEGNYVFLFNYTVEGKPQSPKKGIFTLRR